MGTTAVVLSVRIWIGGGRIRTKLCTPKTLLLRDSSASLKKNERLCCTVTCMDTAAKRTFLCMETISVSSLTRPESFLTSCRSCATSFLSKTLDFRTTWAKSRQLEYPCGMSFKSLMSSLWSQAFVVLIKGKTRINIFSPKILWSSARNSWMHY